MVENLHEESIKLKKEIMDIKEIGTIPVEEFVDNVMNSLLNYGAQEQNDIVRNINHALTDYRKTQVKTATEKVKIAEEILNSTPFPVP